MTDLGRFVDAWLFEFRRKSGITDEAAMKCLERGLQDVGKHYRRIIETTSCDLKGTLVRGLPRLIYMDENDKSVTSDWVLTTNGCSPISDFSKPIRLLDADGVGPSEIAKRRGFGRACVYRVLTEV